MNEGEDQRTQTEASPEKMNPEATAKAIFEYLPQRGWQPPTEGTTDHDIQFIAGVIRFCLRKYQPIGNFRRDLESLIASVSQGQSPHPLDWMLGKYLAGCLANFDVEVQREKERREQAIPEDQKELIAALQEEIVALREQLIKWRPAQPGDQKSG